MAGDYVMVFFGTGSFSFNSDPSDRTVQTVYGVMDRGVPVAGRSELQPQFVLEQTTSQGLTVRMITGARLDATKKGWYLDLGVDAAACVAIEDSAPGSASAVAAGAVVIAVQFVLPLPESDDYTLWQSLEGRTVAHLSALLEPVAT